MNKQVIRAVGLAVAICVSGSAFAGNVPDYVRCLTGDTKSARCDTAIRNWWQHYPTVVDAAKSEGIDPALLLAVVAVESRFNNQAVSPVGARGLAQIMPMTGRTLGVADEAWLHHPSTNLRASARYLSQMWWQFKNWELALAAYNAGPGAVQKYRGIPPYAETRAYVADVIWVYRVIRLRDQSLAKI